MTSAHQGIRKIVIVGGGTAGWMAAAALSKSFGDYLEIRLVESDAISTVGVGEATIPPIRNIHLLFNLSEQEFIRSVNGTFKLGIEFENWGRLGERYFHPFSAHGIDTWAAQFHHYWLRARDAGERAALDAFSLEAEMARANRFGLEGDRKAGYAYHFDAGLYAKLLRRLSEQHGVRRSEGKVVDVGLKAETGYIESVTLESGEVIEGDLFIDCSGFRGLLIEQALETGWEDWGHWLRNDRAIAVQTEAMAPPVPYTRSTARSCGWQWKIPLQNRVGNGLVYSSRYLADDEAERLLRDNIEGRPISDPLPIRFRTGRRLRQWNRNCVALGLASGFLEPLESTSIHLIQNGIIRLIKLFPSKRIEQAEVDQYNREVEAELAHIRDFIIAHYHVTQREDSPYWHDCRTMDVPETLAHKLELFRQTGKIFRDDNELFSEPSWTAVLVGQGLLPESHHPFADTISDAELVQMIARVRGRIAHLVGRQPSHPDFIRAHCHAESA
jgi:tryptophan halogenase